MNKPGTKIVVLNLISKPVAEIARILANYKTPVRLVMPGVFLLLSPACVMTRAEGKALASQVRNMESEVAKLQRVRHDIEILMSGQVRDLFDRMSKLESQLTNLRDNLYESSNKNQELLAELGELKGQLEEAQFQYRNLENDQKALAQRALKTQNHPAIPPLKKDHFDAAKKLQTAQQYDHAIYLFDEYIRNYQDDKESMGQAFFALGEIYNKLGETNNNQEESQKLYKKAIISYQKIIEQNQAAQLKEEALFKMGIILKALGNNEAAVAAFNELLSQNKNSKRALEAKKHLAILNNK